MTGWDILFRSQQQAQGIRRAYEQDVLQRDAQRDATALQTGQLHQQQRQLDQRDVQMEQQQEQFDETMQQRRSEQAQQQGQFEQRMTIAEIEALLYATKLQEDSEYRQQKMAADQVTAQVELSNAQTALAINQQKLEMLSGAQYAKSMELDLQLKEAQLMKTMASIGGTGESSFQKAIGGILEEYGPVGLAMRGIELTPDGKITIHQPGTEGYKRLQAVYKEQIAEIKRQKKLEMQLETMKALGPLKGGIMNELPENVLGPTSAFAQEQFGASGPQATTSSQHRASQLDKWMEYAEPMIQHKLDTDEFGHSAIMDRLKGGGEVAWKTMSTIANWAADWRADQAARGRQVSLDLAYSYILRRLEQEPRNFTDFLMATKMPEDEAILATMAVWRVSKGIDWGEPDEEFGARYKKLPK